MITKRTVLILGAGASMPYWFPSGEELKDAVCGTNEDRHKKPIAAAAEVDERMLDGFIRELRDAPLPSVDRFLERRPEFVAVGKAAIAYHLIRAEDRGALLQNHLQGKYIPPDKPEPLRRQFRANDRWYTYLFQAMDTTFDEFAGNQLSIVTFNYERSLEEFLFGALRASHGRPPEAVGEVLKQIPIVHVYGKLCPLAWQASDREQCREYEAGATEETVRAAAKCIKIISEDGTGDTPELQQARELIAAAEHVFILGFAYHEENMHRLGFPLLDGARERIHVMGTCYGLEKAERQVLVSERFKIDPGSLGGQNQGILSFLRSHVGWLRSIRH